MGGGGFRGFGQCPKENVFFAVDPFPYATEKLNPVAGGFHVDLKFQGFAKNALFAVHVLL